MYIQNKMFYGDFILKETFGSNDLKNVYEIILNSVNNTFNTSINKNISLEDTTISDLIQLFGSDYSEYLAHDNSYILKKHQKISAMKDQMIKDELLKMICK